MDEEQQALASPIAGGLRGIRRSVSSSVFTGRSALPQSESDSISTNLITQNSLTLNSVSLQLTGINEQVRNLNTSLESIKNNLELSDSLEKRKQQEKERREALLAEEGLKEGAESSLEKKIQFALLTPVRKVANFTKGILSRITDSLLFLAGGWLVDQTLTFFRLTSEENVEGLKKFKEQLVGNLLIIGGLVLATTVGLGKIFGLTKVLGATLFRVGVLGVLKRPFQVVFQFIARNLIKFKNLLLGGILGLGAAAGGGGGTPNAQALRSSKVVSNAAIGTAAATPFLGDLRRRTFNIGRKLLGKDIVPKPVEGGALVTSSGGNIVKGVAKQGFLAKNTSRVLSFGSKLLGTFNKLVYVAEGVFDFGDYKKRGNSNFQAFIGSATRGITKYLTFGAGMKAGALVGTALLGPPGTIIGGILGGLGVSLFKIGGKSIDEAAADIAGGLADKATGAIPKGKKRLEDGTIVDFDVEGDKDGNYKGAENEITESISVSTNLGATDLSSTIVPFSKENDFDKKLALDENVDIVTVPLSVGTNLGSGLPDTSSSSTGANKVPTFSTSDYANNFPTITESMFNVSTV